MNKFINIWVDSTIYTIIFYIYIISKDIFIQVSNQIVWVYKEVYIILNYYF